MSFFDLNHVPLSVGGGGDQHQNPTTTSPDHFRNCRDDCLSNQSLLHESKRDSVVLLSDESSPPLASHDMAAAAADCDGGVSHGSDGRWMMPSSKMRIMKKMMTVMMNQGRQDSRRRGTMQIAARGQSQADDTGCNNCSIKSGSCSSSSSIGAVVRACTNCNTTRTPLWRTGPRGPKSLCNACGIRERKARRAMEAAALKGGVLALNAPNNRLKREEKSSMSFYHTVPFKKRCRFKCRSSLSSSSVHDQKKKLLHEVLPKDEWDAAMLLMGLSYGLIRSSL